MLKGNIKIRGITRFYHIDSVSEGELPVRIYTMCLKNYDSLASLHGPLYEARRSFWESGKKYKKRRGCDRRRCVQIQRDDRAQ